MLVGVNNVVNWNIALGTRVKVTTMVNLFATSQVEESKNTRDFIGRVVAVYPFYIVVDNGAYAEAYNKVDFIIGKAKIKELK